MNLLKETINVLKEKGKTPQDVEWVGVSDTGYMSWDEFAKLADEEYDNICCPPIVNSQLVVVGKDWWLEREWENDPLDFISEWWKYKTLPERPKRKMKFTKIRESILASFPETFVFIEIEGE